MHPIKNMKNILAKHQPFAKIGFSSLILFIFSMLIILSETILYCQIIKDNYKPVP